MLENGNGTHAGAAAADSFFSQEDDRGSATDGVKALGSQAGGRLERLATSAIQPQILAIPVSELLNSIRFIPNPYNSAKRWVFTMLAWLWLQNFHIT